MSTDTGLTTPLLGPRSLMPDCLQRVRRFPRSLYIIAVNTALGTVILNKVEVTDATWQEAKSPKSQITNHHFFVIIICTHTSSFFLNVCLMTVPQTGANFTA